jgi:transcriptional regulator with XRE-family HTH domain
MLEQSNKLPIGILFRQKREEKGLLIRQAAAVTELDQAIISRIENCDRLPTKEQLIKLAGLYNLDLKETMSAWLAEKMVRDYGDNNLYIGNADVR